MKEPKLYYHLDKRSTTFEKTIEEIKNGVAAFIEYAKQSILN